MVLFLVPSVAQVLLDPIVSRPVGLLFCLGSVLPLAWRYTHPAAAAIAGSTAWLIPTDGFLFLGYAVAVVLFCSVGSYVTSTVRLLMTAGYGLVMGTAGVLQGPGSPSPSSPRRRRRRSGSHLTEPLHRWRPSVRRRIGATP